MFKNLSLKGQLGTGFAAVVAVFLITLVVVALVAESINATDRVTQQNTALGEQSAAAAVTLRQQAQELAQAVALFKLSPAAHVQGARPALAEAKREHLVLAHA